MKSIVPGDTSLQVSRLAYGCLRTGIADDANEPATRFPTSGHWGNYLDPMLEHNGKIVRGKGYITDDLTDAGDIGSIIITVAFMVGIDQKKSAIVEHDHTRFVSPRELVIGLTQNFSLESVVR